MRLAIVWLMLSVAGDDSSLVRLRLWNEIQSLATLDRRLVTSLSAGRDSATLSRASSLAQQQSAAEAHFLSLMDSVLRHSSWGTDELRKLRRAYPASVMLVRLDADAAGREGRIADALVLMERVVRESPSDPQAQVQYAALLERAGLAAHARRGYARALELAPEDSSAFGALSRLHARDGSLTDLLSRIARLRQRAPDLAVLRERQILLLRQLQRAGEADSLSRASMNAKP